jgi:hypothetical protein
MTKWAMVLLVAACTDKDTTTQTTATGETGTPGEQFVVLGDGTNLPAAALLSVWGTSQDDVFIVGSDDGAGPVVLHWDGAWSRLDTQTTGDLWWVWSDGGDVVWMSGEGARVLTYTRSTGEFTEEVIGDPLYKLFGIWGSSATDIFVAAGQIDNALDGAVYHYDGAKWSLSTTIPKKDAYTRRQAFKVWGSGPTDVWVVGTFGMAMHYDGATWTDIRPEPVNATTTLTTISGCGTDLAYAVGGFGNALVGRWDGAAWSDDSPPPQAIAPFFNGVNVSCPGEQVVACGGAGSIYWRADTGWEADLRPRATPRDFHACWLDDAGAVWAVGGDLTGQTEGSIVYGGDHVVPITTL